VWLWPRVSWRRSARYVRKRILRLSGTPYAIAMGSAVGTFVSFTPFIGFHLVLACATAWLLRSNVVAGALGTFVGNPITFPAIWAGTYEVGRLLLGESSTAPESLYHQLTHRSLTDMLPLIEPMVLGSIPLGLAVGCIVYFIVYKAVLGYRAARRQQLAGRAPCAAGPVSAAAALERDDHAAQAYQAGCQH